MLSLALVIAAGLIAVVRSQGASGGCNAPLGGSLCPYSYAGYHYLCPEIPSFQAADACAAFGWELAPVVEDTAWAAWQTMQECLIRDADATWIGSFNGLPGDPCMIQVFGGLAVAGLGSFCVNATAPVLCREPLVLPRTTTSTRVQTIYDGPVTTTRTVSCGPENTSTTSTTCTRRTVHHGRHGHHHDKNAIIAENKGEGAVEKRKPVRKDNTPAIPFHMAMQRAKQLVPDPFTVAARPCSPVCGTARGGLRIVKEAVLYTDAEAVCRKHGWTLADTTAGQALDISALMTACSAEADIPLDDFVLWIRSYEGVDGGACGVTSTLPFDFSNPIVASGMAYNTYVCNRLFGPLYPLCQTWCDPATTGDGAVLGNETSFTALTVTTTTVRKPIMTVTVTATAWPDHDGSRGEACGCRRCWEKRNNH